MTHKTALLKEYSNKIKSEFGIKEYLRFKMIAYYYPNFISEHRLETMYRALKMNKWPLLQLRHYENGEEYYKMFEPFVCYNHFYDGYLLNTTKFLKFFNL